MEILILLCDTEIFGTAKEKEKKKHTEAKFRHQKLYLFGRRKRAHDWINVTT